MTEKLPKVLIVEDNESWQRIFARNLRNTAMIIAARTVGEASECFTENPDVALIVMDACVPGDDFNTRPLVEMIRLTYKGPMLAISASEICRELLVEAGCTHSCPKEDSPAWIKRLLRPDS